MDPPQKPAFSRKTTLRRRILRIMLIPCILATATLLCIVYGFFIEPQWLRVKVVRIADKPTVRVIHISDIHYKGDRDYLRKVVRTINAIQADFVCFTGDLVEEQGYLAECMQTLSEVNKPLFGVAGNHDVWAGPDLDTVKGAFRKTGGDWLTNDSRLILNDSVLLSTGPGIRYGLKAHGYKRILLTHDPDIVDGIGTGPWALILAGHTHGGQVLIPLLSQPKYDRGLFPTPAGPLHVNPGIGTFYLRARFGCRPEITVIEL